MADTKKPEMVHIKINNIPVEVPAGTMVLAAAKQIGIDIPHLCYHPDQAVKAKCRICSVEVKGSRKLSAACTTVVWEGMEVFTDTQLVRDTQVGILQLIMADHDKDCLTCPRNHRCELQELCARFNIQIPHVPDVTKKRVTENTNPALVRNPSKCIKCGRCFRVCKDVQGVEALTFAGRSDNLIVTTPYNLPLEKTDCTLCGQCSLVCPTAAIVEKDDTQVVLGALQDPNTHVIVQVAPAVRVALGDAFGFEGGAIVTGQMVTALKMLGFDRVFAPAAPVGSISSKNIILISCRISQRRNPRCRCSAPSRRHTTRTTRASRSRISSPSPSCLAPRRNTKRQGRKWDATACAMWTRC